MNTDNIKDTITLQDAQGTSWELASAALDHL